MVREAQKGGIGEVNRKKGGIGEAGMTVERPSSALAYLLCCLRQASGLSPVAARKAFLKCAGNL